MFLKCFLNKFFIEPTWRYGKASFLTRPLYGDVGNNIFRLKMSLVWNADIFGLYLIAAVIISWFKARYFSCESHDLVLTSTLQYFAILLQYFSVLYKLLSSTPLGSKSRIDATLELDEVLDKLAFFRGLSPKSSTMRIHAPHIWCAYKSMG